MLRACEALLLLGECILGAHGPKTLSQEPSFANLVCVGMTSSRKFSW